MQVGTGGLPPHDLVSNLVYDPTNSTEIFRVISSRCVVSTTDVNILTSANRFIRFKNCFQLAYKCKNIPLRIRRYLEMKSSTCSIKRYLVKRVYF